MRWVSLIRPLGVALAVGVVAAALALAGGARASSTGWRVQPSPNPSPYGEGLQGVAATSSTNAWAVGWDRTQAGGTRTLIERWHGKAWKVQPSPHPGGGALNGVAATSSTDAWAVGSDAKGTLIEHWDGTSWTIQPSPNPAGTTSAVLDGVAATSSTDAWAVGSYYNGAAYQTLVEHWDGTAWTVVPSPSPGGSNGTFLTGVAATSATDVWAVGNYAFRALIEHWDGTAWTVVPNANTSQSVLLGVAATSSTNAWAVGWYHPAIFVQSMVEQWDGTAWTSAPGTDVGDQFNGVAATSTTNAWTVGYYDAFLRRKFRRHKCHPALVCVVDLTRVEHWNGTAWTVQPSPNPSPSGDHLNGVAATSSTYAWAVGDYQKKGEPVQTLIEHWNG
jgi:hypothetical protein